MVEIIKNKILVDSCIWIEFLNKKNFILKDLLEKESVCTADIIITEVTSGAKDQEQYTNYNLGFLSFPKLTFLDSFWHKISYARFKLQKQGFQVAVPDLIIAVLAEHYKAPILTKDKHFKQIQKVLDFKLI